MVTISRAPIAFCLLLIVVVSNLPLHAQDKNQTKFSADRLIDSVNRALDKNYIFPEKSKAITQFLKARLKQKAYKGITNPEKMASQLQTDIYSIHKDPHMRVHYDPSFDEQSKSQTGPPKPDTMYLHNDRLNNFSFKRVEVLSGNIGYVEFNGFSGFIEEAKPTLTAAFRFLSNTEAIIIDLRNNGGGSPWMVKQIASYFVKERTRLNDIYDRRADHLGEFWADPKDAENMKLLMPMYILTGKNTFSAAEDFTYAMQVNKRAEIVGDTTGGGAHPTGPVSVGQGFVIDIPFARSINYITKTDWEGVGILPDQPCASENALIKAQQLFFEKKLATATSEDSRAVIQWFIRSLQAHDYDNTNSPEILDGYVGTYDRFRVFIKDKKLYVNDGARTFLMKPISEHSFLGSDWFQIEFLMSEGKTNKMKMMGKPGWVNIHDREK